jgi:hypothetical protein
MISAAAGVTCKAAIRVMNMSLRIGADRQQNHGEFMSGLLPANHTARSNFVVVHESAFWHLASFRCSAKGQTRLEAKRTSRDRRRRINPTRLTRTGTSHG